MTANEYKYWAYLSFSQLDNCASHPDSPEAGAGRLCWGDWLNDALRTFSIPAELVGQINGRGELIPGRIDTICCDAQKLPEDAEPGTEIHRALEQSQCLVVICSPHSAKSRQVNEAVRYFKQLGRLKHILPIVVAGKPHNATGSSPDSAPEDECFVPALRHPVRPDGTIDTSRRAGRFVFVDARHGVDNREILASDDRNVEVELEMAKIQLIALLIGVGFHVLWLREQKRHFFGLAEARHQTREALKQVEEVRRQLQEVQRQAREAQNRALELQNLPQDVHGQIQDAFRQAEEARDQAREAQKQLLEFQSKAREAQTQLEAARAQTLAAESKAQEAQDNAREARVQLEETRHQDRVAQDIQSELAETRKQAQDAQGKLVTAQQQVQEFQNKAREAQAQLEEACTQAGVAQHIQSELAESRKQAQDAQGKLATAQQQVQEFQNKAREAQSQLEAARAQTLAVESKVLEAQNKAQETHAQLEEARNQIHTAECKVLEVQKQAREAQGQRQELQQGGRNARRLTKAFAVLAVLGLLAAGLAGYEASQQSKIVSETMARKAAEEAGNFELMSYGAEPEQIRQVLLNIGGAEEEANRRHSLDLLAAGIPRETIPAALKESSAIWNDQQRSHFQKWLLVRLGWTNPLSAMTNASAIEGKIVNDEGAADSCAYFQLAVLDSWMKMDLAGAFNWVSQLPDGDSRQRALEKIIPALAADNPQNTLARLNDLKPVPDERIYRLLFQCWAAHEPAQAIEQRQQVPDQDQGGQILCSIMTIWAGQKPDAALNWVKSQPDSESKTRALESCFDELAKTDFEKGWIMAESLPEGALRTLAMARLSMATDLFGDLDWFYHLEWTQEIMQPQKAPLHE